MPYGGKPHCGNCQSTATTLWRKNEKGDVFCSPCFASLYENKNDNSEKTSNLLPSGSTATANVPTAAPISTSVTINSASNEESNGNGPNSQPHQNQANSSVVTRKSARSKPTKQSQTKSNSTKGKGRRIIFKKSATKAPTAVATPVPTSFTFYKGTYFQMGDIVSMIDIEGDVYYAQIRGLLQDQYCEKSAVITWLLPTQSSPKDHFDPSTYIIGPEEEIPRKLECMEFVCHAPSDYYKSSNTPYPTINNKPELCYIWSRLRPQIKAVRRHPEDIF
ncbi:GATA zinc finger domain-containing protein 1 [Chamberlinius hualienensis]